MRAIVVREFGTPEGMVIEERPAPHPGPDQVRVDVHAIGVNYPDLLVIGGKNRILPPRPFVPGKDAAGVVSAVGKSVRHCQAGILHQASVSPGPISLTFMAVRLRSLVPRHSWPVTDDRPAARAAIASQ